MRRMCLFISFILTLILLSGVVLSSSSVSADNTDSIDQVNITVPIACTMSGVNTSHTATLNPGAYSGASGSDYQNGIGKTTLTAICNDDNGFSIYAIGFTNNEYSGENHTKLIGTNTNQAISTKAYASGDTTSNWSMKLTKVTNTSQSYNPQNLALTTGYDSWHAIPDTYTKVAQYKANTGSSATDTTLGVKLETTYAAFIAASQPADTYTGQVKYTMVHPYDEQPLQPVACQSGKICYNANGSNVIGTMGQPTISSSDSLVTLLASNFSRQGYGFAGWSNKFDYATNPNQEGIKFYGPQETITFTAGQYTGSNPGLSLYAVWIKSQGNLQDASRVTTVCNGLTQAPTDGTANLSSVSALTDQRDNETYAIAKLADGNCWMIENLRLENTATGNTDGLLAQGYNTSFIGLAEPEGRLLFSSTATANSLYSTDGSTDKTISGYIQGYRFPRYNNKNHRTDPDDRPQSPTTNSATNGTSDAGMYSYGNYYTWSAAIADTTYYTTYGQSVAGTSICPSGWHLPTGGGADAPDGTTGVNITGNPSTYREFYNLGYKIMDEAKTAYEDTPNGYNSYYSSNTINTSGDTASRAFRKYPNNFVCSGVFSSDSVNGALGSFGYYWSSTVSSSIDAHSLGLNAGSNVYPGTFRSGKFEGRSIRCVTSGT